MDENVWKAHQDTCHKNLPGPPPEFVIASDCNSSKCWYSFSQLWNIRRCRAVAWRRHTPEEHHALWLCIEVVATRTTKIPLSLMWGHQCHLHHLPVMAWFFSLGFLSPFQVMARKSHTFGQSLFRKLVNVVLLTPRASLDWQGPSKFWWLEVRFGRSLHSYGKSPFFLKINHFYSLFKGIAYVHQIYHSNKK